jgi:quercetin dioxygenase-like cupin family protein
VLLLIHAAVHQKEKSDGQHHRARSGTPARRCEPKAHGGPSRRSSDGHISVAGGTYTILVTGNDTGGRYCLIDMLIPPGGGPPPHRHDFEEMFTILDGEIEFVFRGEPRRAGAGSTVNVPANAPHAFKNMSDRPARLLCLCLPAGQEEFFLAVGDPVDSRTAPPPRLSAAERAERIQRAKALSAQYRTELLV